jgi:hypothetical protein
MRQEESIAGSHGMAFHKLPSGLDNELYWVQISNKI